VKYGKPYTTIAKISTNIRPFLAMTEALRALRYSTPAILAVNAETGLALLEDFGDETIVGPNGAKSERYAEAVVLLGDLHGRKLPETAEYADIVHTVPPYDADAMLIEVELVLDWYGPAVAGVAVPASVRAQFQALWRERLEPLLKGERTWCLRDFHSPNLHWLAGREGIRRLGLIDYQDTVWAPPAYDLASLLQDARVDLPDGLELRLLANYLRRRAMTTPGFDQGQFLAAYALLGAQRATKILGGFARSDRRDRKPQYLRHLPRIERTLAKNLSHPDLLPVRAWFEAHMPRAIGAAPPAGDA
jgi:N-acetylmuramate 1-kinase